MDDCVDDLFDAFDETAEKVAPKIPEEKEEIIPERTKSKKR